MFKTAAEKAPKRESEPYPAMPVLLTKPDPEAYRLPAYSAKRCCPSCGFRHVTTSYETCVGEPMGRLDWPWPVLVRKCAQCGKGWREEPNDVPSDRYAAVVAMIEHNNHKIKVYNWSRLPFSWYNPQ